MNVELSREAGERVDGLVRSGVFPTAQAALDAALDALVAPPRYSEQEIAGMAARARESSVGHRDGWEVAGELREFVESKRRHLSS